MIARLLRATKNKKSVQLIGLHAFGMILYSDFYRCLLHLLNYKAMLTFIPLRENVSQ